MCHFTRTNNNPTVSQSGNETHTNFGRRQFLPYISVLFHNPITCYGLWFVLVEVIKNDNDPELKKKLEDKLYQIISKIVLVIVAPHCEIAVLMSPGARNPSGRSK